MWCRQDNVGGGAYILNISQYLFDVERANEKLSQMMDGLTIQKVITDYLKYFIKLALERLHVHEKFTKNEYFEKDYDIHNMGNIRYCLVCPTTQQKLVKKCFIDAGIIKEHEVEC